MRLKPENDEPRRHYLENTPMELVRRLVRNHGLRPVVDAIATAALELHQAGEVIKDEYGNPMTDDDIRTAADNLTNGDLY